MYIKGITRRWLLNSMGVIFAILAVVWVFFALAVRGYYYNNLTQSVTLIAKMSGRDFTSLLNSQTPNFQETANQMVAGFQEKNKIELLILDRNGNVINSSSGFLPSGGSDPADFISARSSSDGIGVWTGKYTPTGEKILAVTTLLQDSGGNTLGAARYVVSLAKVDMQIAIFLLISGLVCVAIIFFVIMSGTYFVNSIVVPVREVSSTARKIASGDFDARIDKQYDDEIGELCDTINFMAGELGATERMKNDFISSVSHELRTPLTSIRGWGETVIASGPSDQETLEKGMRVIIEESERLSSMVEELLDFSRMQSGRFHLMLDKIDVLAELGEAVLLFSSRAHREGLMLIYNEPESLPPVMGDRNRLKQVFVNILDNAFKYSDPGGTVSVSTVDKTNHIIIMISDTGCGISKSDLPRVKDKFFKGNSTRRGSGIGLAVADEIVCLHGGTIEIQSKEGGGTKVTITLPACAK
jgi:signal transduction histidine kinase